MKVYELMQELSKMPSGAEVEVGGSLTLKEFAELADEASDEFVDCVKSAEECYSNNLNNIVRIVF